MGPIFDTPHLAIIDRATSESTIHVEMSLDDMSTTEISTGVPFRDHMLTTLGKRSLADLKVQANGDTHMNVHHTVEDAAIYLGLDLKGALGNKHGIKRSDDAAVPLDKALAHVVVDAVSRPHIVHKGEPADQKYRLIGGRLTDSMTRHALESLTFNSGICLHISALNGRGPHHIVKVQFKALARALRSAVEPDPRVEGIPSAKGAL